MVYCEDKWVPMNEKDLPLTLPHVDSYEPTDSGESPLALIPEFVNTTCPNDPSVPGKRETDTMPNWAGSSWYYLRYCDPHNDEALADYKKLKYWLPVDWYNGGMEHTTLHLLYSRFWHKFLYDIGVVPTEEPYMKRTSHGMILGENGEKMSKSRGNVRNPDEYVKEYGADVAIQLLEENAYNTLPESVAKQIVQQAKGFWLSDDEINYQNGGLMHFKVTNIKYRSLVPLLVKNWNFTIESTAKCQPRR